MLTPGIFDFGFVTEFLAFGLVGLLFDDFLVP